MAAPEVDGPWDLIAPLGRGGAGEVWRAVHRATGELAAVKILRGGGEEVQREIRALARLRHPGVVRVHDSGQRWYAMELVEGTTLRARLGGAPALTQDLGDFDQVAGPAVAGADQLPSVAALAGILAWLHGEGVVHRDVKPENLVIRADGTAVLVDFGLAGDLGREELDLAGTNRGTASYAAPEVIAGQDADARADLYALGCVLYEVVAGEPPFVGPARAVLRQHLETPAPRLDHPLAGLVDRLLEKDPARRLVRAEDVVEALGGRRPAVRSWLYRAPLLGRAPLLADLDAWLDGRAPVALLEGPRGSGRTRVAREIARRAGRRGFTVVSGRAAPGPLGALAPVTKAVAGRVRAAGAPTREALFRALADALPTPALVAVDDLHLADGDSLAFLGFLLDRGQTGIRLLATWVPDRASEALRHLASSPRLARFALDALPDAWTPAICAALTGAPDLPVPAVPPSLAGAALQLAADEGVLARAAGRWTTTGALAESPEALARRRLAAWPASARRLAELLALESSLDEPALRALLGDAVDDAVGALDRSAVGDPGEGIRPDLLRTAIAEVIPPDRRVALHLELAAALDPEREPARIGHHLAAAGRSDQAVPWLLRGAGHALQQHALDAALALTRQAAELGGPAAAAAMRTELATRLNARGRGVEALELVLAILPHTGGDRGLEVAALRVAGACHVAAGRVAEGQAALERALERAGDDVLLRAHVLLATATVFTNAARRQGARAMIGEVLANADRLPARIAALGRLNLAMLDAEEGRFDAAQAGYEQALGGLAASDDRVAVGVLLGNLANLLALTGRRAEAVARYREVLALHREVGNRRSEAIALLNLAESLGHLGEHDAAREQFAEAIAAFEQLEQRRTLAIALVYRARWARGAGEPVDRGADLARAEVALREAADTAHLALCLAERGILAVERGEDPAIWLAEARELAAREGGTPGEALAELERLVGGSGAPRAGNPGC